MLGLGFGLALGLGLGLVVGLVLVLAFGSIFFLKKNPSLLFFDNESVKTGIKLLASLLSYIPWLLDGFAGLSFCLSNSPNYSSSDYSCLRSLFYMFFLLKLGEFLFKY